MQLFLHFRSPCLPSVPLGPIPEFLVTELALASHSIPSLTLASASLLSPVLESHFPSAIIVQGSLLPHTLELIYELNDFGRHSVVIVVGETDENVLSKASEQVNVARWADIEAQGKAAPPITSPAPGDRHSFQRD
jgi:long-chain acyl-CoA synthetase